LPLAVLQNRVARWPASPAADALMKFDDSSAD
jgi:hypothetical protein